MDMLLLGLAAFFAGFVDSIVGGGGLVQVPALFSFFPGMPPATLLGTNKFAGVWGTTVAARNYLRQVKVRWAMLVPAAAMAFLFSFCGAYLVTHIPPTHLRKALPFVLVAVAIYTFKKKDFGSADRPLFSGNKEIWLAMLAAPVVIDFVVHKDAMVWPMVAAGTSNDDIMIAREMAPDWSGEDD